MTRTYCAEDPALARQRLFSMAHAVQCKEPPFPH